MDRVFNVVLSGEIRAALQQMEPRGSGSTHTHAHTHPHTQLFIVKSEEERGLVGPIGLLHRVKRPWRGRGQMFLRTPPFLVLWSLAVANRVT